MTITSASYKEKFPTFQFCNCDIGFEGSLGESENPLIALKQLRELAIAFHKQEFPHLYDQSFVRPSEPLRVEVPLTFAQRPKSEEQISREQQIEGYYQIIRMATTQKSLELHRPGITRMNDESLTREFNNKINTLQ